MPCWISWPSWASASSVRRLGWGRRREIRQGWLSVAGSREGLGPGRVEAFRSGTAPTASPLLGLEVMRRALRKSLPTRNQQDTAPLETARRGRVVLLVAHPATPACRQVAVTTANHRRMPRHPMFLMPSEELFHLVEQLHLVGLWLVAELL